MEGRQERRPTLLDLPCELLVHVVGFVGKQSIPQLAQCARVCKAFHRACDDEQGWHDRCVELGVPFNDKSWKSSYQEAGWFVWDPARCDPAITIEHQTIAQSSGGCMWKTVYAKAGFIGGVHKWAVKVVDSVAGCRSAVGVSENGFPLRDPLGMAMKSWCLALSPGDDKPQGPRRVQVARRLIREDIVVVDLDMNKGVMTISIDGQVRAHFEDEELRGDKGTVLYPVLNTCHGESYELLKPNHPLLQSPRIYSERELETREDLRG